jgi:hypothetical protein
MREYRRRIAYLHAYEQGVQMRCAGFVKLEEYTDRCRLSVQLRQEACLTEEKAKAYLCFVCQNRMIGLDLGELSERAGAWCWQGEVKSSDIQEKGFGFTQTGGVWVRCGKREYAAEWNDVPVDISRFVLYPKGGQKCIRCPRFGKCERSSMDEADRRREVHEGSDSSGT